MKSWQKTFFAFSMAGLALSGLTSCLDSTNNKRGDKDVNANAEIPLNIAVFSDDHLYDAKTLGSTGSALDRYISNDRKMLIESEKILDSVLADLKSRSNIQYLLILGDLTKDGERVNHELLAKKLQKLEDETNIEVFVINGNHDLSNQDAVRFNGDTTTPVETVNRDDFKTIYANFGYNQAVSKDPQSLSYSANLGKNYRLISIDSCIYNNDKANPSQQTGGVITKSTMDWVLSEIKAAKDENRIPIGMMHHGVVPHTGIQPTLFAEYLVDDYQNVMQKFLSAGMNIVFTGHFHSQDTASVTTETGTFYDVETGSLVTFPCPQRFVTLNGNSVSYTTKDLDSVEGVELNGAKDFISYSNKFLSDGMIDTYKSFMPLILISQGYATQETAAIMTDQILSMSVAEGVNVENLLTAAFSAHYKGDEEMSIEIKAIVAAIGQLAMDTSNPYQKIYEMLYGVVTHLYTDSTTSDNTDSFNIN